ncbi:hypothetical protein GCM10009801_12420 [Streptomyces albiaxialis]|uniref:Tetratricopeptide repeat protein n=1 Tax=Streptomyces albiaxialis TaxID=329523 RepID=A0ABP5H9J4_9ACTN
MFKKKPEQHWKAQAPDGEPAAAPAPSPAPSPAPAVWDVLIGRDGRVVVGGEDFPVPAGEPVHVAVLDAMHYVARTQGEPVEVVIVDELEEYATHIEVGPDGSSRLLQEGPPDGDATEVLPPVEPEPQPAPQAAPRPSPRPEEATAVLPVIEPEPEPTPAPVAPYVPEPAPAPAPAPPEERRPSVAPVGSPPVPDELAPLVTGIGRALDTGSPERAAALAFRLREHATRLFGAEHPLRLEALELEAFAAYRCGNFPDATVLCLELSRMRHRQGDPRAHEDLTRAAAAWSSIEDLTEVVDHGRALLAVWSQQGSGGAMDTEMVNRIIRRIHALTRIDADPEVTGVEREIAGQR